MSNLITNPENTSGAYQSGKLTPSINTGNVPANSLSEQISSMNPEQLSNFFIKNGTIQSVGDILNFLSRTRDSTIEDMTNIVNNSKTRQEEILKEIQDIKYQKIVTKDSDSTDKKNLEIEQASQYNTEQQKKIDALNNQLTLEKTFVSRASQVIDRLQSSTTTMNSFLSSLLKNYQSGVQYIAK